MQSALEILFNEWLVGFGVPILIGVGFTLLADEFEEYKAARWCFSVSAVWMCGKVLMWSVFTSDNFRVRAVIVFVVFGVVGIGLMEALRLANKREGQALRTETPVEAPAVSTNGIPPSAVAVSAYLQPEEPYAPGGLFAGIKWLKQYVDVRLDVANGPAQIKNLDFLVSLDTSIAGIGQISQFPGVTAFPANEPPSVWLRGTTPSGSPVSVPIVPLPGTMQTSPTYRVHCSEVFSDTTVHFVIASIALNPPTPNGGLPKQLFATRKPPATIRVKGSYSTIEGKEHPVEFSYRFPPSLLGTEGTPEELPMEVSRRKHGKAVVEQPTVAAAKPSEAEAALQFTFWPVDPNTETLTSEKSLPIVEGVVTVTFSAKSVGRIPAKNGKAWIQICDGCKFAEDPVDSEAPPDDPTIRRKRFDGIFPGVYFDPTTLKIIPPQVGEYFTIAFKYVCDQCPPIDVKHPQKLRVHILRP